MTRFYIVVVRARFRPLLLLCSACAIAPAALAQQLDREVVECRGQLVREIVIRPRPPFPPSRSAFFSRAARTASRLHETTKESVIRRYLALHQGKPCTELRRTESERILRAQPFIADATVVAYADGPNAVAIEVTTVDEVSVILDGALSGSSPHVRAVRVGEANLFGAGVYAAVRWQNGLEFRDGYSARVAHYQLFGRPYQIKAEGARRELGQDMTVEASHPYLTDLQRISWRANYGRGDGYSSFRRRSDTAAALALRRTFGDVGGVVRVGVPGLLTLVGGSISYERDVPGSSPVVIASGGVRPDTSTVLINRYRETRQTRANALFGFRRVRFMQVRGFDALDGVQDVRKGVQFSGMFGRGMTLLDRRSEKGVFASAAFYGGMGSTSSFIALDASIEGRREPERSVWSGVLSSARLALYTHPFPRHTWTSSTEWSAGWRSRIPFQLTFADRDGGVRGYRTSNEAGGRRLVARFEDRYQWGRFRQYATIGVAGFADFGKMWAGDAPFGTNTPVRTSVGVALLAAIPPRSQRLVRAELAYPVGSNLRRTWEARLVVRDATRLFWREPGDVRRVRERGVPSNVFSWP